MSTILYSRARDCVPKSLLLIAPVFTSELQASAEETGITITHCLPSEKLPQQRFDMSLVDRGLEALDVSAGRALLGMIRNTLSDEVLVITQSQHWQLAEFIALGFRQEIWENMEPARVYRYILASYNHQRSWNNARFWANPQNFNRFRW